MNKFSKYISVVALLSVLAGCGDFDEINTNPDTTSKVPSTWLCTNAVLRVTKFGGDNKAFIASGALPKYVAYAAEAAMAEQYNKIGAGSFEWITVRPTLDQMTEFAKGGIYEDSYRGVALFVKAYLYFRLSMDMGDIPYAEADQGQNGLYRPKYDTQEFIFKAILDDLKNAEAYFAKGRDFEGDPVYGGSAEKWRRACNALSLKILMSMSKRAGDASLGIQTRFAEIVKADALLRNNADNFQLVFKDAVNTRHPLYQGQKFTDPTILSSLVVDSLKRLNDYRLYYFAEPSPKRIADGMTADNPDAYVGVNTADSYNNISLIYGVSKDCSPLHRRYALYADCEPLVYIGYGEQCLTIAEAIERGWVTGAAKDYYEAGVKANLDFVSKVKGDVPTSRKITQAYIDGYFTGEAVYKTSTSADERLKQIWLQRYLAAFMQDGRFSYYEFRRTGCPAFPLDPTTNQNENNKNGFPMRWLYPANEATYNRDNLEAALDRQYEGYDEINKIMWLLK